MIITKATTITKAESIPDITGTLDVESVPVVVVPVLVLVLFDGGTV